ncbi:hypothetical protein TorRG33x02_015420 [Trema orientale]|uniref:F-box domain-containing protein n=1 Tax=Trema orientale TaxID=63057 RepID=A0A2P5FXN7_TREOI|nr:hypothetical protein TorRG33x02_015420 [Trema orientale]
MKRYRSTGSNSSNMNRFRSTGSFGGMEEVIERNVLKFVPGKSLCRLELLSKSCNTYISSQEFMASHMVAFKQVPGFFLQLPRANNPSNGA